ncbi:hypothetical protein ACTS95_09900 [Empedobacter brevis]
MKKLLTLLVLFLGLGMANAQNEKFNTFYIYNFINTSDAKTAVFTPIVTIQVENADNSEVRHEIHNQFTAYLKDYVKKKMGIDGVATFGRGEIWLRSVELDREEELAYAAKYQKDKKILFTGSDFDFKFVNPKK